MTTRTIITQVKLKNQFGPSFQSSQSQSQDVRSETCQSEAGGLGQQGRERKRRSRKLSRSQLVLYFCFSDFGLDMYFHICISSRKLSRCQSDLCFIFVFVFLYLYSYICISSRSQSELWRAMQFISTLPGCLDLMLRRRGG